MQIVPIRDLKDTVKIEEMCIKTQEPIFVTKNGYGRLVVMDINFFEKLINDAYEAIEISKGLEDIKKSKTIKGEKVFKSIEKKYGFK